MAWNTAELVDRSLSSNIVIQKNMRKLVVSVLTSVYLLWAQANQPGGRTTYQLALQESDDEKKAKDLVEYIKASYTKHEFLIPMRDGVRLFTSVYTPKDSSQQFPIMINGRLTLWRHTGSITTDRPGTFGEVRS